MRGDGQLAKKSSLKLPCWLLPASVIAVIMLSGCNADTRDEQEVGSGNSRPYSSIAVNADTAAVVGETATMSTSSSIDFNHGRLSVSLHAMPLHRVITEVSRQTGIDIQFIGEHPAATVDMQFSDSLPEPALRRLLGETNSIFLYADTDAGGNLGGQLTKVLILPQGETSHVNNGMTEVVDTLSVISEQIQNSIPRSYQDVNTNFSINDTLTDQSLDELAETLRKRISSIGQAPN